MRFVRRATALTTFLAMIGLVLGTAEAGTIAYQVPAGTAGNQAHGGPLGMEFNVDHTIVVTQLGVFDDQSNGLNLPLEARLYDRTNTGTALETVSFPTADPGTLIDGSRFKPLATPRLLTPGFQGTIVSEGHGATERNGNSGTPPWTTNAGGGMLSFVGTARWGTTPPGGYPPNADLGPANRYAAGTFVYEPANIAYEVFDGTVGTQDYGGSLGMDFNTNRPLAITHLGVFDSGQDGLARDITAYVYDRTTQTALTSLTLSGSGDTLIGGSRFRELAQPLILPAGFQGSIVTENYGPGELNGNAGGPPPTNWQTYDGNGRLSFVGGGRYGSAGSYPGGGDGGPANRYAAGTFIFDEIGLTPIDFGTPIPVPNPSFELPAHGDGGFSNTAQDWPHSGAANGGNFNPPTAGYPFIQRIPDGNQVGFLNGGNLTSPELTERLQPDTLYVLEADWGHRTDSPDPQHSMTLVAGGTTLGWVNNGTIKNGPLPLPGEFDTARGYFTANHNAALGTPLQISLQKGGLGQTIYDNVRLLKIPDASVPLLNASFEAPVVGLWSETVDDWVEGGPGGGVFRDPTQIIPADGEQTAFIRGGGSFTQTLTGVPLEGNNRYFLLAEVADRNSTPFAGYQVELLAGGQTVAIDDNSLDVIPFGPPSSAPGQFYTTSVIDLFVGVGHPLVGEDLGIRLTALGSGTHAYFDNVRLFAVQVPEPSTFVLALLGIAALAGWGWRKRRNNP